MIRPACFALAFAAILLPLRAQGPDFTGVIGKSANRVVALPSFRGSGDAQKFMDVFNEVLWDELSGSGVMKLAPKTMYPLFVPQQTSDFQQPPAEQPRKRRNQEPPPPESGGGRWMSDWSNPPVSANYLAFGYTGVTNGVLVLRGNLFDLSRGVPANAQVLAKTYLASVDEAGARRVAHEFAADILTLFGGKSLYGTHIYFVSDRTGHKEIWVMDPDGSNQRQITKLNYIAANPAVSPDGTKIAFTGWPAANQEPRIYVYSTDPVRDLGFRNQKASVNGTPSFSPDGKQIVYMASVNGSYSIFLANVDGSGAHALAVKGGINVEPKINPKTGSQVVFVSDRSGPPQIYSMNLDGQDVERLTSGVGEAVNPSWNLDGQTLAFAWTQGYEPGSFNIFVMDTVARNPIQLTQSAGKNENPSWAPDGAHLAFGSNRGGTFQIWSMLADGSQTPRQLTTQGNNTNPAWSQ